VDALALPQNPCFEAALLFAKSEGIVPAPESSHAIRAAVDEAIRCREANESKVILFNLSGHGHFDMSAYAAYLQGDLVDLELDEEALKKGLASLPRVETPAG